ncbi:MAG: hypothetical protein MI741_23370, partial [Rhodospirillales bacterium]|nr:hypothetical protein [Rhodospirillales bacterium]
MSNKPEHVTPDLDPDAKEASDQDRDQQPYTGPERRKSVVDRRYWPSALERRRGPGKRRSDFVKSADEGEM